VSGTPLPCPFCGIDAVLRRYGNEHTKQCGWSVECPDCHVIIRVSVICQTLDWALETVIEKWNRRAAVDGQRREGEDWSRLIWLLGDVAERLPMTDVGRERYGELLGWQHILKDAALPTTPSSGTKP